MRPTDASSFEIFMYNSDQALADSGRWNLSSDDFQSLPTLSVGNFSTSDGLEIFFAPPPSLMTTSLLKEARQRINRWPGDLPYS